MKKILFLTLIVLLLSACVPSQQQVEEILSAAEQTAMAQVTFVPVTYTPNVDTIVAQTFAALTTTVTATPEPGSISGTLSYPSSFIPALRVVAFQVSGFNYRYVDTMQNQTTYQITGLAPGLYRVVAYTLDGTIAGGHTQMVLCGLLATCTDHTLVDVEVKAGKDTPSINPGDWYAPAGSFPAMP